MAEQKRKTFWQNLSKSLFGDSQTDPVKLTFSDVDIDKLNPDEFQILKRETQQTMFIQSQWRKIDNELYQKAVFYEPTRLASYYDYEAMEFTPEISATLDIYMEESTTANEETGQILNIYSESDVIRKELESLFYDKLSINTNLAPWIRNTVKYGDNFVYLKILPKKGVIGAVQLPNIEVTRVEPTFSKVANLADVGTENNIKFYWKNKDLEFNSFEVAHFRLLGDDRKLPYGTSILEKARRIWKQLLMAEDAMLVYRISRAPERRVYKIFVGNMDDKDIPAHVERVANEFKRTQMVNNENGSVDLRYNQLAVDQDYFIPIRDVNQSMPIETLPGAQNLAEIADIEYIQQKLFSALRLPKSFLGFEEPTGDGKNLAMLDVRFARAVHRVQKSIIQELNKIALIHLYSLGYHDDLKNFVLELNSPSTQSDLLKLEKWREKINLYRDAVSDAGNGFGAVSMTWAKQHILDMSEADSVLDIQRQAIERAAGEEIKIIGEIIGQTGIFSDIYSIYGVNPESLNVDYGSEREGDVPAGEFGGSGGGSGGFGDFGGDEEDLGSIGDDLEAVGDEELNESTKTKNETLKSKLKRMQAKKERIINEIVNSQINENKLDGLSRNKKNTILQNYNASKRVLKEKTDETKNKLGKDINNLATKNMITELDNLLNKKDESDK